MSGTFPESGTEQNSKHTNCLGECAGGRKGTVMCNVESVIVIKGLSQHAEGEGGKVHREARD